MRKHQIIGSGMALALVSAGIGGLLASHLLAGAAGADVASTCPTVASTGTGGGAGGSSDTPTTTTTPTVTPTTTDVDNDTDNDTTTTTNTTTATSTNSTLSNLVDNNHILNNIKVLNDVVKMGNVTAPVTVHDVASPLTVTAPVTNLLNGLLGSVSL